MALNVIGRKENDTIYAQGDECLYINPYDSYHLFTLYNNWKDGSTKLNISNGMYQSFYLVFRSEKKEVRIKEYSIPDTSSVSVDKTNGEILFRISKEDASNILSLSNRVFYITRIFAVLNDDGNVLNTSSEEVVYTGCWESADKRGSNSLSSMVSEYSSRLSDANNTIKNYLNELTSLRSDVAKYAREKENDRLTIEDLQRQIDELNSKLSVYENANEYTGTVVDNNAHTVILQNADSMTADQLKESLESLNKKY